MVALPVQLQSGPAPGGRAWLDDTRLGISTVGHATARIPRADSRGPDRDAALGDNDVTPELEPSGPSEERVARLVQDGLVTDYRARLAEAGDVLFDALVLGGTWSRPRPHVGYNDPDIWMVAFAAGAACRTAAPGMARRPARRPRRGRPGHVPRAGGRAVIGTARRPRVPARPGRPGSVTLGLRLVCGKVPDLLIAAGTTMGSLPARTRSSCRRKAFVTAMPTRWCSAGSASVQGGPPARTHGPSFATYSPRAAS